MEPTPTTPPPLPHAASIGRYARWRVSDPNGLIGIDGKRYPPGTKLAEVPCAESNVRVWISFGQIEPSLPSHHLSHSTA